MTHTQVSSHLLIRCFKLVCSVTLTHTDTDLVRIIFLHFKLILYPFLSFLLFFLFFLHLFIHLFSSHMISFHFVWRDPNSFTRVYSVCRSDKNEILFFCRHKLSEHSRELPVRYNCTELPGDERTSTGVLCLFVSISISVLISLSYSSSNSVYVHLNPSHSLLLSRFLAANLFAARS